MSLAICRAVEARSLLDDHCFVHRLPRGQSSRRMPFFCEECPDRIKVALKGRICANCVIRTGRPNPPSRTEEEKRCNRELQPLQPSCLALRPDRILYPFPTTVEKNAAYIAGKAAFDAEFRGISKVYPERKVTISVVVHSEASKVSFNQECCNGSLVGGKKKSGYRKFKIVLLDFKHEVACWRGLLADKRRAISVHQGSEVFFSANPYIADHVEKELHLHVQSLESSDEKITLLQSRADNGGCMTAGPFRVGLQFIVHEEDGSLPLSGAIFRESIPKGMPDFHDVVDPAKPRAVKRKVSD